MVTYYQRKLGEKTSSFPIDLSSIWRNLFAFLNDSNCPVIVPPPSFELLLISLVIALTKPTPRAYQLYCSIEISTTPKTPMFFFVWTTLLILRHFSKVPADTVTTSSVLSIVDYNTLRTATAGCCTY